MSSKSKLVVIYGPPFAGKSSTAWELARSLPGKSAVVSLDALLDGAIAVPDADDAAELEMVHIQLRLLVANYLKNGYNVVAEGPFIYERGGVLFRQEQDIDQLIALMRNLVDASLVVRLTLTDDLIEARARSAGREPVVASARRISAAYRERTGEHFLSIDTGSTDAAEVASRVREALMS